MKNEVFCNKDNLRLNCPNAEEIYVEEATYGRMEKDVCKTSDYKIGRKATCKDVIPKLNKRCATKVPVMVKLPKHYMKLLLAVQLVQILISMSLILAYKVRKKHFVLKELIHLFL